MREPVEAPNLLVALARGPTSPRKSEARYLFDYHKEIGSRRWGADRVVPFIHFLVAKVMNLDAKATIEGLKKEAISQNVWIEGLEDFFAVPPPELPDEIKNSY